MLASHQNPAINPILNVIASKDMKTDSDDCETIDKIAQMVSNFTSSPPPPPAQQMAQQLPSINEVIIMISFYFPYLIYLILG